MLRLLILALTFMPAPTLPVFAAPAPVQKQVSVPTEKRQVADASPSSQTEEESEASKIPQLQEEIIADHGPAYPSLVIFAGQSINAIPLETLLPVKIGGLFRPPKRA